MGQYQAMVKDRFVKDIKFACVSCGQHYIIDARVAGHWVTCTECNTRLQVPQASTLPSPRPWNEILLLKWITFKCVILTFAQALIPVNPFRARRDTWPSKRIRLELALLPAVLLLPLLGIVHWPGSFRLPRSSGERALAAPAPLPDSPRKLLQKAEANLTSSDLPGATETLNTLLSAFPRSEEAQTVRRLLGLVRANARNPEGVPGSFTEADAAQFKRQIEIKESLLRHYASLPAERRANYNALFGPRTFSEPDLSLNGVLATLRQVEATQARVRRALPQAQQAQGGGGGGELGRRD
jgi:hypothetical protein